MAKSNGERHAFQAEVSKLLGLMANSLYRDKEIFLRELISNASDACDKLRYAAITRPELMGDDAALAVTIRPDSKDGVLVVADNGIGMNREELIDNLGTIARSGTEAFVKQMAESQGGDGEDEADGRNEPGRPRRRTDRPVRCGFLLLLHGCEARRGGDAPGRRG